MLSFFQGTENLSNEEKLSKNIDDQIRKFEKHIVEYTKIGKMENSTLLIYRHQIEVLKMAKRLLNKEVGVDQLKSVEDENNKWNYGKVTIDLIVRVKKCLDLPLNSDEDLFTSPKKP